MICILLCGKTRVKDEVRRILKQEVMFYKYLHKLLLKAVDCDAMDFVLVINFILFSVDTLLNRARET
jgi:hypothetical protein